jgi:hypothetical protein
MRPRVPEIDQHAIAHVFRDKAIEPGDDFGDCAVVRGDDLAQIFRIESHGERGRADQIAEHHRQLPAFGLGGHQDVEGRYPGGGGFGAEHGNCVEELAAMDPKHHAEILEILRRELRQHVPIDFVVAERRHVALKAQTL